MRRRLMAVVMALCVSVSAIVCDAGAVYASAVQTEGTGAASEGTAQNLETIEGETEITQEQDAGETETGDTEPGETEGTTSADGIKQPAESEAAWEGTTETEEATEPETEGSVGTEETTETCATEEPDGTEEAGSTEETGATEEPEGTETEATEGTEEPETEETGTTEIPEETEAVEETEEEAAVYAIKRAGRATIVDSGDWGDNCTYTLDSDGVLTIAGSGVLERNESFGKKSDVRKLVVLDGITGIDADYSEGVFSGYSSLLYVELPQSLRVVGANAFDGCNSLINIELTSAEVIGRAAFEDCKSLTNIEIPVATKIGDSAFRGCRSLTDVNLPVTECIEHAAFCDCSSLKNIDMPIATEIGDSAFRGCNSLTSIKIAKTVKEIGSSGLTAWVFTDCHSLMRIDVEEGNQVYSSINGVLYDKAGDKLLVCPQAVSSYQMPDTVTRIAYCAFGDCKKLTQITIPERIEYISEEAFIGCSNLKKITFLPATSLYLNNWLGPIKTTYLGKERVYYGSGRKDYNICKIDGVTIYGYKYADEKKKYLSQIWEYAQDEGFKFVDLNEKDEIKATYTVKFNGNGSTSGSTKKQSIKYGSGTALRANGFKRKGYTFTGWNTKANGKGKAYKNKADGSKLTEKDGATVTLYAQWKKTKYKITYNLNGGKNSKSNPSSYNITTKTVKLKNPTKKGYTFKGWYSDKKCTKRVKELKKGSTGNKTLYAKWSANKYTITFKGNGSTSGSTSAIKNCTYGKKVKLRANGFKRKGYAFVGWNTKANGKGKMYKNKAEVKNLTAKSGGKVTLYAQWKKNK